MRRDWCVLRCCLDTKCPCVTEVGFSRTRLVLHVKPRPPLLSASPSITRDISVPAPRCMAPLFSPIFFANHLHQWANKSSNASPSCIHRLTPDDPRPLPAQLFNFSASARRQRCNATVHRPRLGRCATADSLIRHRSNRRTLVSPGWLPLLRLVSCHLRPAGITAGP